RRWFFDFKPLVFWGLHPRSGGVKHFFR
ncbi:MAG: hypothetical protein JWP52_389, partial [Rhizobacter sp.]|nr:hypothetical protein [Rhizobacter sp.]